LDIEQYARTGGRPAGGVGVLWKNGFASCTVLDVDELHRCIAFQVKLQWTTLICVGVYLPSFSNTDEYEEIILECFSFIDSVFTEYVDNKSHFVLLGDFNFDDNRLNNSNRLCHVLKFMKEYKLLSCDHLDINNLGYSYCHSSLNVYSLIDHAIVTENLLHEICKYEVIDSGLNFSDHCAIAFEIPYVKSDVLSSQQRKQKQTHPAKENLRWDNTSIAEYFVHTGVVLNQLHVPTFDDVCEFPCAHSQHRAVINNFACDIAKVLNNCANCCVTHKRCGVTKPFWSAELSQLKSLSVEAHRAWVQAGRPHTGVYNDNRLLCKTRYKRAIRLSREEFGRNLSEKMALDLLKNDQKAFWYKWNNQFHACGYNISCISGCSNPTDIAEGFANSFGNNFTESTSNLLLHDRFITKYDEYVKLPEHKHFEMFTIEEVNKAVKLLKRNKAADGDGLTAEHIIYANRSIDDILCTLFNLCCIHGYVPDSFASSVIIPVIKDKFVKTDTFENFRPISLVCIFSKVFEQCLAQRMYDYFEPDDLQYGFVPHKGCQKALFTLETVANYYTARGSPVFLAALDASKAFDRINHYGLFCKLMSLSIPLYLINIVVNWHLKLKGRVKWGNVLSTCFYIKSGIRQGGLCSAWFFNVYIFDLIQALRNSDVGCHIGFEYVGCILFADDILLISASVIHLQYMLDICVTYGVEFDIKFNAVKSHLIQIGLDISIVLPPLQLGDASILWTNQIKYLGVLINAGKRFAVCTDICRRKFLSSSFSILQRCSKISEEIKSQALLHSCLPILSYGVDILSINKRQLHDMSVCYNTAIRRCFRISRFTSVRNILYFIGSMPLPMLFQEHRFLLIRDCISNCSSSVLKLCGLLVCNDVEFVEMCYRYDIHCNLSKSVIKDAFRCNLLQSL
jgi:hypothetical protein